MSAHLDHLPGSFFGPSNLVDLLKHRALHQAHDRGFTFLRDGETDEVHLTYEALDRQARTIGAMLQSMNLGGERALLLYPTGLDFVAAFFGCLYAGVIAVPAFPPRRNRNMSRIEGIAADADAKIAMTTQSVLERVQLVINDTRDLKNLKWLATDRLPEGLEDHWRMPDVHGDTLAFLQYTSGSTGSPKGVMLNHANLIHNSAMIAYAFEHTRSGQGVFWLPLYHDMGLIGGILQPLYIGQPNVLFSPASFLQKPYRWLRAISHYGSTISGGPNFAYDLCVDKITPEQKATLDLSRWSLAFNGAEPVRNDTIERFTKAFEPRGFRREAFYPCYGLAEATLIVSGGFKTSSPSIHNFSQEDLEHHRIKTQEVATGRTQQLVSSGGNLLDQKIIIVDPETRTVCPDDRVGEIWVSGPSVAQGYWRRTEETQHTFRARIRDSDSDHYLRTSDLGFLLKGELFITGRLKDLIILRGVNYYPQDIEKTVERCHRELRPNAGAVFTVSEDGKQHLVIVQEVSRRRDLDFSEIFETIRREVVHQHELKVDAIVLLKAGSIPQTSSGKIQRHACRVGFEKGSLAGVARWSVSATHADELTKVAPRKTPAEAGNTLPSEGDPRYRIAQIVFDAIRHVAKERAGLLTLETNILDLGLDSLERMEIVASLEETFGNRFPEEILSDLETCEQVVAAVGKYLGSEPIMKIRTPAGNELPRPQDYQVPGEDWQFARFPEYQRLKQSFQLLKANGLENPYFSVRQSGNNATTQINGRKLINFSSYDYLGMAGDPVLCEDAKRAIDTFGTSASASRLVSGENTLDVKLDRAISNLMGTEDAITYVSGHSTNETTIGHLFGPGDLILHDSLAHNSIVQGSILSGARRRPFPHNDWRECDRLLSEIRHQYRRVLVVIEGVYSMDGDYPNLPRFVDVREKHQVFLMIDEAHSIGTMGSHGRGLSEYYGVAPREVDLWMGTLSKALGSCGGYITGRKELIEYLKYTAPGFVFSVGLSPSNAAAALAALRLLDEEPQRVASVQENARLFLQLAKRQGLDTGNSHDTPIIPIILGSSENSLILSNRMFDRGINVHPILHPAVEESLSRLRFFIMSTHTKDQIEYAIDALVEEVTKIAPGSLQEPSQPDLLTDENRSTAKRRNTRAR